MNAEEMAAAFQKWADTVSTNRGPNFNEVWIDFWLEDIRGIRNPALLLEILDILEGKTTMPRTKKITIVTDEDIFGPTDELTDDDIFGTGEIEEMNTRNRNAPGRPADRQLKKKLKPGTQQGDIFAFLLAANGSRTVDEVENEFFIKRNTVLSTLNVVAKATGVGYNVIDERVTVLLPTGVVSLF